MGNDEKYVTENVCAMRTKELSDDIKKQGRALFGSDGRGGMQRDITKILTVLEDGGVKSSLRVADKIIVALITVLGGIAVAIIMNGGI